MKELSVLQQWFIVWLVIEMFSTISFCILSTLNWFTSKEHVIFVKFWANYFMWIISFDFHQNSPKLVLLSILFHKKEKQGLGLEGL